MKIHTLISFTLIACFCGAIFAQTVPSGMTYQGRLTDASNAPVPDGTGYEIEVRLWSAPTGGTLLWGTRYTGVPLKSGAFNLILGSGGIPIAGAATTDLKAAFNTPTVHLGLTTTKSATGAAIPSPTEILPRQQIFSTPYAFRAETAAHAAVADTVINGIPTGSTIPFAGASAPAGYLVCDGAVVSRTTYASLFTVIGTSYGAGDGATTFNLPDLRGRGPIGAGSGPGLTPRALSAKIGEEAHALTIEEMPAHTHDVTFTFNAGSSGGGFLTRDSQNVAASSETRTTTSKGGGNPHNTMQPSIVLNFIIKY